ncbi:MAG: phosphoribulokinase [Anaerolineales bacterium]|nr:phosphoribulokinase [Anaerolineales bacterium]
MNRKVVMIGIAGDSAAGKTTLSKGIAQALGEDQVTAVCCDHYHRHNRQMRKELGVSALSPEGNYIDIMEQHFRLLREGQPILMPIYNHSTGDFDAPVYVKPTKYVIIEGLLPLHTRRMRLNFDVKVYLNPPEALRYAWKIKRDTTKRGYTREQVLASLEKRQDLSPRYIHPQRGHADMVVQFYPPEGAAEETGGHLNACLVLKPTVPHPDLSDVLAHGGNGSTPALQLELGRYEGKPADILRVDGSLTADKANELIQLIRNHLPPNSTLDINKLGRYQSGLEELTSYPLALTQLLIAYHMITAGEAIQNH